MEEDIKIKVAELSEAIKYINKKTDYQEQEIKSLHRENAKQSEEIRDSMYLADTIRSKFEQFEKYCSEHKTCDYDRAKDIGARFNQIDTTLTEINEKINQVSAKKLIITIETIIATVVLILGLLGSLSGWIKFGG